MNLKVEEIKRLAELAKLEFSDEEALAFAKEFEPIKEFADEIVKADVEMSVSSKVVNMSELREDKVCESMAVEQTLLNAPESRKNCFAVGRVVEGGKK